MCVAFIPFPTALLAEYIQGAEGERQTAVAVYSATLAVTGIFFTLLWLYAAGNYRLVDWSLSPALLRSMTRRYVAGMVLYILAFALAFVSVVATLLLIVALALLFVLPEPGERSRKIPLTTETWLQKIGNRPRSRTRPKDSSPSHPFFTFLVGREVGAAPAPYSHVTVGPRSF
jgi:MFS family permease